MLSLKIKRILKSGFINFWRNGIVSLSAVFVMTITLFIVATILFTSAIINHSLVSLKNSVDVNINILNTASENQILEFKSELESLADVESVMYISRDQALQNYRERNADNQKLLAALDELAENPLNASLNIKAREIDKYDAIQTYINQNHSPSSINSIIEDINYKQKEEVISRLNSIIKAGEQFGLLVTIVFVILSILITMNTIRLTIFISKEEIRLMNLVGAEHGYISGPFAVTGAIYGIVSSIAVLILMYPLLYIVSPKISNLFFDFNLFGYYVANFGQFFLIILFAGVFISSVSSLIAINRYLKN